jgi:hypothetical protein
MPPWTASRGCTDYYADQSLTDDQIGTFAQWIDAGGKQGDAAQYVVPDGEIIAGLSRVDRNVAIPVAYTPQTAPDDYRCFLLDWPETTTKYVTGFRANPGNPAIVHHAIAFVAKPDQVAQYQKLDDADPGPGYTCYSGPGGSEQDTAWLAGWAPGSTGTDFPPGTGIKMLPGSKIVLQIHYNTLNAAAAPDQTSIDVKLDDKVDKEAIVLAYANLDWLGSRKMLIPAGDPDAEHDFSADLTPIMSVITAGVIPSAHPFTLYSASLHMHTRGTRGHLEIDHPDGTNQCLLDIQNWNFHWQRGYGFTQPKTFMPGDKLKIECHWDNTADHQPLVGNDPLPVTDVVWGEKTQDEMCLGSFYITQ